MPYPPKLPAAAHWAPAALKAHGPMQSRRIALKGAGKTPPPPLEPPLPPEREGAAYAHRSRLRGQLHSGAAGTAHRGRN